MSSLAACAQTELAFACVKTGLIDKNQFNRIVINADKMYPKKAGKLENHHIIPKFMGGLERGPTVLIPASYHQLITNAFRREFSKEKGLSSKNLLQEEAERIMKKIYGTFQLPMAKQFVSYRE